MLYCQECGASNADDARFCNICGTAIAKVGEPGGPLDEATGDATPTPTPTSWDDASDHAPGEDEAAEDLCDDDEDDERDRASLPAAGSAEK